VNPPGSAAMSLTSSEVSTGWLAVATLNVGRPTTWPASIGSNRDVPLDDLDVRSGLTSVTRAARLLETGSVLIAQI
jgi:hypothetical protein